jgi:hypothetical protein
MYYIQRAEHILCDDGYNTSYEINKKQQVFFSKPFAKKNSKDYSLSTMFIVYYFTLKKFK